MKGRLTAALVVVLAGAGVIVPGASAGTIQSGLVELDITPERLPAAGGEPTRIRFTVRSNYSDNTHPFTGKLTRLVIDLSDSFVLNTQGFPQCDPAVLPTTTTEQALAACGPAQIGSGDMAPQYGPVNGFVGDITVFNATPSGGVPRFVVHTRTTSNQTYVWPATITPSTAVGAGHRLDIAVSLAPGGFVFPKFDFTIGRYEGPNGFYLTGACQGGWLFYDEQYYDDGTNYFGQSIQPCTPKPVTPPQNTIVVGEQTGTSQKGSQLVVTAPGPGSFSMVGLPTSPIPGATRPKPGVVGAVAAASKKKKKKKAKPQVLVASVQATASAAGDVALPITLTRAGLQSLVRTGKVVSPVSITFTPTGGTPSTTPATVTIQGPKPRKKPKKKK